MAQNIFNYRIPSFDFNFLPKEKKRKLTLFELSSHARVRSALELGLSIKDIEFNIFVIGENRTGRMNATLEYVKSYLEHFPPADDWIYLNNFQASSRPKPFNMPAGTAIELKKQLNDAVVQIRQQLSQTFASQMFQTQLKQSQYEMELSIKKAMTNLKDLAEKQGFELKQKEDGTIHILRLLDKNKLPLEKLTSKQKQLVNHNIYHIKEKLAAINEEASRLTEKTFHAIQDLKRRTAINICKPIIDLLEINFQHLHPLIEWFQEMKQDLVNHVDYFMPRPDNDLDSDETFNPLNRYAVNVVASHFEKKHPPIIVESNPTYENLFGVINYQNQDVKGFTTDFTMIKSGSLHHANGGVLVIRAEDISQHPTVWNALKAALRDKKIRIAEMQRANGVPMMEALDPHGIPLNIKIIVIGAPHWYYTFFFQDPDFQTYFKIKGDIDRVFPAVPRNLAIYGTMLRRECIYSTGFTPDKNAISYVLGYCARVANHRQRLSTQFEVFLDVLKEAAHYMVSANLKTIGIEHVKRAIDAQAYRNMRAQDYLLEYLNDGMTFIKTQGSVIGQINGLTIQSDGIDSYGAPSRITAQTYMGHQGIINIEHLVEMGGPIQHKGVLSLEGFLRGTFGQKIPPSFGASITFEQNYSEVEGDSASVAELVAIISSLADLPIRQDIAITGSLNQMGLAQPIGGINEKIEGFYFTCKHQGFTGYQGVIIPLINQINLCLREEISNAIEKGLFHIWGIEHVSEALEILLGTVPNNSFQEIVTPIQAIYNRVYDKIIFYDQELSKRR